MCGTCQAAQALATGENAGILIIHCCCSCCCGDWQQLSLLLLRLQLKL